MTLNQALLILFCSCWRLRLLAINSTLLLDVVLLSLKGFLGNYFYEFQIQLLKNISIPIPIEI